MVERWLWSSGRPRCRYGLGLSVAVSAAYTPLAKKPAPGGMIIRMVNGTIPADSLGADQQSIGAKAIGWTAKKVIFDGSVEDLNAKLEEAISEKPTIITLSGWPAGAI
jgi:hypothetical protein